MCWQLQGVCYIISKQHELWSTNGFKLDSHFYPPYVNSAFYVIASLRRRRSANGTQPNFAKRQTVNHANSLLQNSWGRPQGKKWGPRNFNICSGFSTTSTLNGEYLLNETGKALESTKGLLHCPKFNELWSTNGLNGTGLFPNAQNFVPCQSIAHPLIGINVVPHSDSKWNGIGFVCSSDSKPQKMLNWKCCRVGRP